MRALVVFSLFACAAADLDMKDKGKCVVDGGEAASDLLDASIFIWGAKQRCGKAGMVIKCEIDIASAMQSLMSMTNTILKVVGRCGHDFDPDCGRAATRLTKGIAGLSAAVGGVKQKCNPGWVQPGKLVPTPEASPCAKPVAAQPVAAGGYGVGTALPAPNWAHGASALCVLDVKNSAKNLLKSIKYLVKIEKKCEGKGHYCTTKNSLKVVGALAGLGEYLAASVGDCHLENPKMAHDAECAQESIMVAHHVTKISEAGMEIAKECKPDDDDDDDKHHKHIKGRGEEDHIIYETPVYHLVPRLYEEEDKSRTINIPANIALGAFLPVTAVVSFVAGRSYANRRSHMAQGREVMSDHE